MNWPNSHKGLRSEDLPLVLRAIENHQNDFIEVNQEVLPVKILIRNEYTIQPSAV